MDDTPKPYRPSNGTEGNGFMASHCYQCLYDNPDPDKNPKCEILTASMCYGVNDPEYPKEWIYKDNKPTCTKFVKWDWDTDGDPNDPDNQNKPPDLPDPRQLNLFPLTPDEIHYDTPTKIRERETARVQRLPALQELGSVQHKNY